MFEGVAGDIFEKYQEQIDEMITKRAPEIVSKIPVVMDRLSEGNPEAVSQALSTCRRIVDTFADSVFPATDSTIEIGGNTLILTQDKVQNRINAYVHIRIESKSRKKKIRQNLSNLYDRISSGVHTDVDSSEAMSLFFNTYLLIGEIINLPEDRTIEQARGE